MEQIAVTTHREAIESLNAIASASTPAESLRAMEHARRLLGPDADAYEPLMLTLVRRAEELAQLRRQVGCDWLTGVANRRAFEQALVREFARHQRTQEPFAIILLDLDDLKQRNDSCGHAAGDAALIALAQSCERVVRSTDLVARLGGDEFAVLLPGSTHAGAAILAARIRECIEDTFVDPGMLRVSLGISSSEMTAGMPSVIMDAADADLYRDKTFRKRLSNPCAA